MLKSWELPSISKFVKIFFAVGVAKCFPAQKIFVCSSSGIKDLEDILVRLVKSENSDIRQKGDPARLAIAQCQLVVVNSYTTPTSDVKDAPLTQVHML